MREGMKNTICLAAAVILILLNAYSAAGADNWVCPACNTECTGNFCANDGTARPEEVGGVWNCPECGAECDGNFCANDGTAQPVESENGGETGAEAADEVQPILNPAYDFSDTEVGDTIKFGACEQDNHTENGSEEIEWIVLAKEENRILVISRYALIAKRFNSERTAVVWESSSIRKWLNEDFLNVAFSAEEQAYIPTVTVSADPNPDYSVDPGNDTEDRIFLLSAKEADRYFNGEYSRMCAPTAYAAAQGVATDDYFTVDGAAACWWWLRSPGSESDKAAGIHFNGADFFDGNHVEVANNGVRPAMWIIQ